MVSNYNKLGSKVDQLIILLYLIYRIFYGKFRSLSRDDIIDLEPLYENTCSRAARVSVSKRCVPPGTVIILAEEVHTGEVITCVVWCSKLAGSNFLNIR